MTSDISSSAQRPTESLVPTRWKVPFLTSSLLWGGIITVGFYSLISHLPVHRELLERYFCSHPLEYATASLFFVGIAILILKAVQLSAEKAAFANCYLFEEVLASDADHLEKVARIEEGAKALSRRFQTTLLAQRVRDASSYLRGRRVADGFEEHLKYLAELASEKLHGSYALVRTITWAVPILGFLGTVMGITIAIANVRPEQLDNSLTEVTGGLAIAFDTTALALTLSMLLVFASFVIERSEQSVLDRIEEFGIKCLSCLAPSNAKGEGPLAVAEAQAAKHLLEKTEAVINWQTQLWQDSIESLRNRWSQTLSQQQQSFEESLKQGMSATLTNHTEQLAEIRGELMHGFRHASKEFKEQLDETVQTLSEQVGGWQRELKVTTEAIAQQTNELKSQGVTLLKITQQEEHLARLQALLTENLQAVRAAETFEDTLHSLSAAVHLLTARTKPKAA